MCRKYKCHVHLVVRSADGRYTDRDSLLLPGRFRYTERPVPTTCRGNEEFICSEKKQFPAESCFFASLHKIPYSPPDDFFTFLEIFSIPISMFHHIPFREKLCTVQNLSPNSYKSLLQSAKICDLPVLF